MDGSQALERYLDLVFKIANSIYRAIDRAVELDELVSMGVQGLLEAARRADPSRRDRFIGFAYMRVRGAILDSLGHTATLPRKSHRLLRAGRPVARPVQIDPRILDQVQAGGRLEIEAAIDGRRAWKAVSELPPASQQIVRAIYIEGRSLTELAAELGVSVSAISRRHQRALARLRARLGETKP